MNAKQEAFAREYAVDHNATQAAIRSGYSPKTAYSQGQRLLKHDEVKAAVEIHDETTAEKVELTREMVIHGLLAEAAGAKEGGARVKAWELLGKHLAMFSDRVLVEITDDRIDAELARLTAELAANDRPADA